MNGTTEYYKWKDIHFVRVGDMPIYPPQHISINSSILVHVSGYTESVIKLSPHFSGMEKELWDKLVESNKTINGLNTRIDNSILLSPWKIAAFVIALIVFFIIICIIKAICTARLKDARLDASFVRMLQRSKTSE